MELWIRSQDRMNLVKIKQINVNYRDSRHIIANYIPEMYENAGEYYELLGTYETKERALEVLDEIQELFIKKDIVKSELNKDGLTMVSMPITCIVYEMPKE